jgi:hypothetical protein
MLPHNRPDIFKGNKEQIYKKMEVSEVEIRPQVRPRMEMKCRSTPFYVKTIS